VNLGRGCAARLEQQLNELRGLVAGAWRSLVWTIGSPFLLFAILFDNLSGPLWARAKISNTYRVVATKGATS